MGGYNIDQDEVERIYAELMPKDAGIPVPVVESKSETVVEEVKEDSVEEESDAASAFMRQASTSEGQTKPAAVTESVSTSKTETSKKESSSESPKIDKKGGSKEELVQAQRTSLSIIRSHSCTKDYQSSVSLPYL